MSPSRLEDLSEMFSDRKALWGGWPSDVLVAIVQQIRAINAIVGTPVLRSHPAASKFAELGAERLRQIWRILPCPWCGLENSHSKGCPMSAAPSEFDAVMAAWEIRFRDARHGVLSGGSPYDTCKLATRRARLALPLPVL